MGRLETWLAGLMIAAGSWAVLSEAAVVAPGFQSGSIIPVETPTFEGVPQVEQAVDAFRQRDYDKCFKLLEEAKKTNEEVPPPRLMLAKLYLTEDMLPQARANLEVAAMDSPEYPETYNLFGRLALREGRLTDADLNFAKSLSLTETDRWSQKDKTRFLKDCLNGLAAVAEVRKDWKAAEKSLVRWLELDAKNSVARQRLARALFFQERPDEAFGELETASKNDIELPPPAVNMGWFFTQKGNAQEAESWMRKAVEQNPEDARTHANLANWLLQQNRAKEAKDHIRGALERDPKSIAYQQLQGQIFRHLKEYDSAEKIFSDLNQKFPAEMLYSNQLALSLIEQEDRAKHQRARQLAEVNFRQYPKNADVLTILGRVLYRLGEVDNAEQALRQAIATGRASSETAYYLALIAVDRGRLDEAKDVLKRALDTPGQFVYRQDAQALYDRLNAGGAAAAPVGAAKP
ncbi:MAG: tetratricopeptide repeat protein [Planctomycetota bacterium]